MKTTRRIISILLSLSLAFTILATAVYSASGIVVGDLNDDGVVTRDDAIVLLYHSIYPDENPVNQPVDYTDDGEITRDDAIYLLYHSIYPENYPLPEIGNLSGTATGSFSCEFVDNDWDTNCKINTVTGNYESCWGSHFPDITSIITSVAPLSSVTHIEIEVTASNTDPCWNGAAPRCELHWNSRAATTVSTQSFTGGKCYFSADVPAGTEKVILNPYAFSSSVGAVTFNVKVKVTADNRNWVAAWGSAQLQAGAEHLPQNLSLANNTVRQQIRMTLDGETARFVFSNQFGDAPLTINAATVAHLNTPTASTIDTSTLTNITFNGGETSVTIPAGSTILSDDVEFSFKALDDLAVSLYLGSVPSNVTSHTASRCTTWIASGNQASAATISGDTSTSWYFLSRVDVVANENAKAIICLGDSLTDGASVSTNAFARWPDELARKLKADSDLSNYSVINMGIGATPLTRIWGNSGLERLQRDVLNVPGAECVIILYGVNDIGSSGTNEISQNLIDAYKEIIQQCHAQGIKVYGCTITPIEGSGYYSDIHEVTRTKFNEYIMSDDSGLDGYIDTASAVADPSNTKKMQQKYVSVWGDWLHFNDTGYKFVGKTIYDAIRLMIN